MIKKLRNQNGSAMLTVLVVIAILIILGVALLDSSTSGFKTIKHQETTEIAYSAAESATDKCFCFIEQFCSDQKNTSKVAGNNKEDFARNVIKLIKAKLIIDTDTRLDVAEADWKMKYKIGCSSKSNVSGEDMALVEIEDIKYLGCDTVSGKSNKILVNIGVSAAADLDRAGDKVANRKRYSQRKIEMYMPSGFKLNAAIYTVGDLMINNIDAQVTGDVVAYGTSPQKMKQPKQYYYGGIYAKNNGHLSVNGNAYSRGLIRTGEYSDILDPSTIYVYKDAIANGIQIFGRGQKIVVGRNAYTFDDLELNGEDSVIAVNGSFIGLTHGSKYHDESSGIVNSAIIHYAGSDASLKSRIVINGDVILNGGTFRIDQDGNVEKDTPQIEDASVIASKDGIYSPKYKEYLNKKEADSAFTLSYEEWLLSERGTSKGFANLIQCWKPIKIDFTDATTTATAFTNDIPSWITNIDAARYANSSNTIDAGSNNTSTFNGTEIDSLTGMPYNISGFCRYAIGANDRIYFMDEGELDVLNFIKKGFIIDNIDLPAGGGTSWDKFWDGLPSGDNWKNVADTPLTPSAPPTEDPDAPKTVDPNAPPAEDPVATILRNIRGQLEPRTEVFADRKPDYLVDSFINTLAPAPTGSTSENKFLYMSDSLETKFQGVYGDGVNDDIDKYIFNLSTIPASVADPDGDNKININGLLAARALIDSTLESADKYFLFINNDPSKEFIINGKVNGIIFSLGRVVLKKGADVTGSIIAAGKGYISSGSYVSNNKSSVNQYTDPITGKITNFLPQILKDGDNLDKLDDGSYAGVLFMDDPNNVAKAPAKVTFPGTDELLEKFKIDQFINLDSIFNF